MGKCEGGRHRPSSWTKVFLSSWVTVECQLQKRLDYALLYHRVPSSLKIQNRVFTPTRRKVWELTKHKGKDTWSSKLKIFKRFLFVNS